jgi:hypothetical protein
MESLTDERPHIVIEFKQGDELDALKADALEQIINQKYYAGLKGEILCVGIAHNNKKCAIAHKTVKALPK